MVLTQSFNGAGDTWTPTWINIGVFWIFEIPLAWLLATRAGWGSTGVFTAITTAYSLLALVSAVLFRRGKWKLRVV
jgi:Na+-driven multidrug efflux pump